MVEGEVLATTKLLSHPLDQFMFDFGSRERRLSGFTFIDFSTSFFDYTLPGCKPRPKRCSPKQSDIFIITTTLDYYSNDYYYRSTTTLPTTTTITTRISSIKGLILSELILSLTWSSLRPDPLSDLILSSTWSSLSCDPFFDLILSSIWSSLQPDPLFNLILSLSSTSWKVGCSCHHATSHNGQQN